MRRNIVLLLITGIVWAQADLDKLVYKIKFIPISNIIMFSIIVASVIGRLSTEPRQAHLMLFFDKRDFITPNVVADKITMVM